MTQYSKPWHTVRRSNLHCYGVFANKDIPADTTLFEYEGERISAEEADEQAGMDPDDPYHTFFFSLSCGLVIDGNQQGNDARWVNHSCEPNCEAQEDEEGERVYLVSLRPIKKGEELTFDYGLVIDEEMSDELKAQYACLCNTTSCRGTMLALTQEINDASETE